MLSKEVLNRILLYKYLLSISKQTLKSNNDLKLFAIMNLLQDSLEAFLIASVDHVDTAINSNTKFDTQRFGNLFIR